MLLNQPLTVVNKEQHRNKNITRNQNPILRDKRKSIIVEHGERSQQQDQSMRISWHKSNNWSIDF